MVVPTLDMLPDQAGRGVGVEEAEALDPLPRQALFKHGPQRPAEPGADRNAEALLSAPENRRRHEAAEGSLQNVLGCPPADLELGRNLASQLDEGAVEERRTDFKAARHAGAVDGREVLLGEVELAVLVNQTVDRTESRHAGDLAREVLIRVEPGARGPDGRRQRRYLLGGTEAAEQQLGASLRRVREPANELLEQELVAPGAGGGRQSIDRRRRPPPPPGGEVSSPPDAAVGDEGRIPAEELVAAVAAEDHGDGLTGEPGEHVRRQKRAVDEGFVQEAADVVEQGPRVAGREHDLSAVGAALPCDEAGKGPLVVAGLFEAETERLQPPPPVQPSGDGHDRTGVDATAEEHPERHVADQLGSNRRLELRSEPLGPLLLARGGAAREHEIPVWRDVRLAAGAHGQHVAGRELRDAREDRVRGRHVLERQVAREALKPQLARHRGVLQQGSHLGPKYKGVGARVVVQRLLAHAIPGKDQVAVDDVPDGEGKHAVQAGHELTSVLFVRVDENFRVRRGAEPVAAALQLVAELAEVVDFPVLHDPDGAVLIRDRLSPRLQVDDAEAADAERDGLVHVEAFVIRAAVTERVRHSPQGRSAVHGSAVDEEPRDAAHGRLTPLKDWREDHGRQASRAIDGRPSDRLPRPWRSTRQRGLAVTDVCSVRGVRQNRPGTT